MSDILRPLILELDTLDDLNQGAVIVQHITNLVEAGLDPNGEDRDGLSPLMRVIDLRGPGKKFQNQLVRTLMEHGANPLINDLAIRHTDGLIVGVIIGQEISRYEKLGKPLRAEDGGNLFHVLAQTDIALLLSILCENYNAREETNFPRNWLSEKRPGDGATPLHVLWGEKGLVCPALKQQRDITNVAWNCTLMMAHEGADFLEPDNQGRRTVDLMNGMVQKGFEVSEDAQDFLGGMSSILNKTQLEESTQSVDSLRKLRRI